MNVSELDPFLLLWFDFEALFVSVVFMFIVFFRLYFGGKRLQMQ